MRPRHFMCFDSGGGFDVGKMLEPPLASAAVRSGALFLLLLISFLHRVQWRS